MTSVDVLTPSHDVLRPEGAWLVSDGAKLVLRAPLERAITMGRHERREGLYAVTYDIAAVASRVKASDVSAWVDEPEGREIALIGYREWRAETRVATPEQRFAPPDSLPPEYVIYESGPRWLVRGDAVVELETFCTERAPLGLVLAPLTLSAVFASCSLDFVLMPAYLVCVLSGHDPFTLEKIKVDWHGGLPSWKLPAQK